VVEVAALDLGATNFRARIGRDDNSRTGAITLPNFDCAEREFEVLASWLEQFAANASLVGCVLASAPNVAGGRITSWPNRPHWNGLALKSRLEAVLNCKVDVVTDGGAAAVADAFALSVGDLISVVVGTGIGAGIVANGDLLSGASGRAGEVGHIIVGPADGPACVCGRNGCLQAYFRPLAPDEPWSGAVLEAFARTLVNLSEMFDPQIICLSGGRSEVLVRSWAEIEARCETLTRAGQSMPRLVRSRHPHDAPLTGAYLLAMRALEKTPLAAKG